MNQIKNIPFPLKVNLKVEEIQSLFSICKDIRNHNKQFHYQIFISNSWSLDNTEDYTLNQELKPTMSYQLGRFQHPDKISEIIISVILLTHEVNPSDYYKLVFKNTAEIILTERIIDTPLGSMSDLLTISSKDIEYISRTFMIKDANRLFIIKGRAQRKAYNELAEYFLFSLSSFQLIHYEGTLVEKLEQFTCKKPIDCMFLYPSSWKMNQMLSDDSQQNIFELFNENDHNASGKIHLNIFPPLKNMTPQMIVIQYVKMLNANGFSVNGAPLQPTELAKQFNNTVLAALTGSVNSKHMEFPVYILEHDKACLLLGLITPAFKSSPEWWAINKRAFEIVRDSLIVGDTKFEDNESP